MRHLPRFALGTIQPGVCREPIVWGLTAALAESAESPVLFRSSCDLSSCDPSKAILGRACRHLDSWAMSRSDAISALARAARPSDTAIIEGQFDTANLSSEHQAASSLDRLCEWLDLPRVAIIDVRQLAQCGISHRPAKVDALILDRVHDSREAAYWETTLEALWKTPVVGWLDEAPGLRSLCTSTTANCQLSSELCGALAARLLATLRLPRLRQLASRGAPLV